MVKNPPANAGSFPGLRRSPAEGRATQSSILAWRIPRTEAHGRLQSTGWKELDTAQQLNHHHWWLRLIAFTTVDLDLIPGQGIKIPQATRRSQKKKKNHNNKLTWCNPLNPPMAANNPTDHQGYCHFWGAWERNLPDTFQKYMSYKVEQDL